MATTRIVTAAFIDGFRRTVTRHLYQYDYGQKLVFEGLELPAYYEVHFSNVECSGESTVMIGDASGVDIPDEYLATGQTVYAWAYLHETGEDGETRYMVEIPVNERPEVQYIEPTPAQKDVIDQAIEALNAAVGVAEDEAAKADQSAEDAEAWAIGKRDGVDVGPGDETYQNNAKYYAFLASQELEDAGYIAGTLNADGELVIEVVNLDDVDVTVQDQEVVVIYE